jgi:hypothetical protein
MAPVEPVSVEEATIAYQLRNHLAQQHIAEGYSVEEATNLANCRMFVLAYRSAVQITGGQMADDVEEFLQSEG